MIDRSTSTDFGVFLSRRCLFFRCLGRFGAIWLSFQSLSFFGSRSDQILNKRLCISHRPRAIRRRSKPHTQLTTATAAVGSLGARLEGTEGGAAPNEKSQRQRTTAAAEAESDTQITPASHRATDTTGGGLTKRKKNRACAGAVSRETESW